MRGKSNLRLSEVASVFVHLDYVANLIVNANHSIMREAVKGCVADCVPDCVCLSVPQPTEWQHIGNQIDGAMIFAWADFGKRLNGLRNHWQNFGCCV
jgi:hypothetical protein